MTFATSLPKTAAQQTITLLPNETNNHLQRALYETKPTVPESNKLPNYVHTTDQCQGRGTIPGFYD